MSKKWMIIAGVAALAVVLIAAALFLLPGSPYSPTALNIGSKANSGSTTTSAGTNGGSSTSANGGGSKTSGNSGGGTGSRGTDGGSAANNTGGSSTSSSNSSKTLPPLTAFPPIADPGVPPEAPSTPVAKGHKLAPLTAAPDPTISALKLGLVPDGSAYQITMRPYGFGPTHTLGSRLAIRVDAATPLSGAPALARIVNANALALANTKDGGTVTEGGTYTATLTFRSDGTMLLPILSKATAQ